MSPTCSRNGEGPNQIVPAIGNLHTMPEMDPKLVQCRIFSFGDATVFFMTLREVLEETPAIAHGWELVTRPTLKKPLSFKGSVR